MSWITIERGAPEQRKAMEIALAGLDGMKPETAALVVTAWVSSWGSSPFAEIADLPYSTQAPSYRLIDHVNEVTRTGLALAARAEAEWGQKLDPEILLPILILHDVDKPLMYVREDGTVKSSPLSKELPHGVPGAMLLRDLGFDHRIVSTVATHAANAPFHGGTVEAYVLHYADFFSTDHALMLTGNATPYYQRHWR